jgi:hypothetical protein
MNGQPSVDQTCPNPGDVTNLLREWRNRNPSALERLTPMIYDDLLFGWLERALKANVRSAHFSRRRLSTNVICA